MLSCWSLDCLSLCLACLEFAVNLSICLFPSHFGTCNTFSPKKHQIKNGMKHTQASKPPFCFSSQASPCQCITYRTSPQTSTLWVQCGSPHPVAEPSSRPLALAIHQAILSHHSGPYICTSSQEWDVVITSLAASPSQNPGIWVSRYVALAGLGIFFSLFKWTWGAGSCLLQ